MQCSTDCIQQQCSVLQIELLLFQGPRIWNSLPIDIKNAPTFSIFKRMIKPFLRVRQNAT